MTKFVLGVVTGVLLTVLAFQALDTESVETSPPAPGEPEAAVTEPVRSPIERPADDGAGLADFAEPASAIEEAEEEVPELPPTIPITLPPEFEWLASEASHRAFEREGFDPAWSAEAQATITRYFAERPELTNKYGFAMVHCRQSGCEVLIVAYDLDESRFVNQFASDLMESGYAEQPWANQFLGSGGGSHHEDGISTIVWFLTRL